MKSLLVSISLLLILLCVLAQTPLQLAAEGQNRRQAPVIRGERQNPPAHPAQSPCRVDADSNGIALVPVTVSVIERQTGKYISNLEKRELHVFENGVEQEIVSLERLESPVTVALLIDTSYSVRPFFKELADATNTLIAALRQDDRLTVITFDDAISEPLKITRVGELPARVLHLKPKRVGTRLFDAVRLVLNKRLRDVQGRKVLILFTDGDDTTSRDAKAESNLHDAVETEVVIYPVQYDIEVPAFLKEPFLTLRRGAQTEEDPPKKQKFDPRKPSPDGVAYFAWRQEMANTYLLALAKNTGGSVYHAASIEDPAKAFASILAELSSQYILCYRPTAAAPSGQQRTVRVRVDNALYAVRARVN
jgi:VWFA-related protein